MSDVQSPNQPDSPTRTTDRRAADRERRLAEISNGAAVRAALGQGALYRLLPDGRHEITFRTVIFTGGTLAETINMARTVRPR